MSFAWDQACAGCGDFVDGGMGETDEEEQRQMEARKDNVYYCDQCHTFTRFSDGHEVNVIFTTYGTRAGMKVLWKSLRTYLKTKNNNK